MNESYTIHLIEDEISLGEILLLQLKKEHFEVIWSKSLAEARNVSQFFELAIIDFMLPDGSGFDLIKEYKKTSGPRRPKIICMTALSNAENRLSSLEDGADDFLPKPFLFKELLIRIQRVLSSTQPKLFTINQRVLDFNKMSVTSPSGSILFLTNKDFNILQLLIQNSPRAISRDEILDTVWGKDQFPSQRTIDNTIVRLREALGDQDGIIIRSVRGLGYQWVYTTEEKI